MKHILFGSIGVLAETSAIQQACYNQALAEFDTGIYWNTATYCHLIREPGGYQRLENLGIHAPKAKAIHERKQQLFAENLVNITPRAGVVSLIDACRDKGVRIDIVKLSIKGKTWCQQTALRQHIGGYATAQKRARHIRRFQHTIGQFQAPAQRIQLQISKPCVCGTQFNIGIAAPQ